MLPLFCGIITMVKSMNEIQLDGKVFTFVLTKKRIRNLILHVKSGNHLTISAPLLATDRQIVQFVLSRKTWILEHAERLNQRAEAKSEMKASQGQVMIYGTMRQLCWITGTGKPKLTNQQLILYGKEETPEAIKSAFDRFAKQELAMQMQLLRPRWDQVVDDYHMAYPTLQVRDMNSRWGSCVPSKGKITLSLRLIHYPKECIDSVLWHEYAHLIVPNHSKRFYQLIEHHMPRYPQYKAILNGEM